MMYLVQLPNRDEIHHNRRGIIFKMIEHEQIASFRISDRLALPPSKRSNTS